VGLMPATSAGLPAVTLSTITPLCGSSPMLGAHSGSVPRILSVRPFSAAVGQRLYTPRRRALAVAAETPSRCVAAVVAVAYQVDEIHLHAQSGPFPAPRSPCF